MNHAGMCFPGIFGVSLSLARHDGWVVQPLAGVAFDHPWVIWWLPPGWSQVLGGVRAELDDFEAAIPKNNSALRSERVYAVLEGVAKRYQLETLI